MTVDIYKGRFASAESAYDYIDSEAIIADIQKIKQIAGEVARAAREVLYARDYFTPDDYYAYGDTFTDDVESCAKKMEKVANDLDDTANEAFQNLQKKLDIKQELLNEEAKIQDKKLKEEADEKSEKKLKDLFENNKQDEYAKKAAESGFSITSTTSTNK